jgi:hypothetical protein
MTKWLVLATGVFLVFNGVTARTYGYESAPVHYCFNMDYIRIFGCFGNSTAPHAIKWGAAFIGAGLVLWSFIRGRREKA